MTSVGSFAQPLSPNIRFAHQPVLRGLACSPEDSPAGGDGCSRADAGAARSLADEGVGSGRGGGVKLWPELKTGAGSRTVERFFGC